MSRQPHLYGAVAGLIIKDEKVLLGKRKNTGFYDGGYALPGGHIEEGEIYTETILREMKEELGIDIFGDSLKPYHVMQKLDSKKQTFDIGFIITERTGNITNSEPNKCEALERHSLDNIPAYTTGSTKKFIEAYISKEATSIVDMR